MLYCSCEFSVMHIVLCDSFQEARLTQLEPAILEEEEEEEWGGEGGEAVTSSPTMQCHRGRRGRNSKKTSYQVVHQIIY